MTEKIFQHFVHKLLLFLLYKQMQKYVFTIIVFKCKTVP